MSIQQTEELSERQEKGVSNISQYIRWLLFVAGSTWGCRHLYNRLKNLVRDKRKESVIFLNIYAGCYMLQVQHEGSRRLYKTEEPSERQEKGVSNISQYLHWLLLSQVQHEGSRRLYNRLKNLARDKRKESVIFHNEFQVYAHCEREPGETLQQWQVR